MSSGVASKAETESGTELKRNALGLTGAMMLGVVIMAPALAIYTNWGFMIPYVGRATSAVFVISLVMSVPTAYSYAVLSGRMPNSGSAYKWAGHLIGPRFGIAAGFCAVLYYAFMMPYNLPALALLFNDLARSTSSLLFGIVMFGAFALAVPIMLRGVAVSIRATVILCSIEATILSVIAVAAWVASSHHVVSLAPLNPGGIPSLSALSPALVLGVLSFTGFDAVSTVAEETRTPKKLIPRATIFALIFTAIFWVVASGILSDALPPSAYDHAVSAGGFPGATSST
jgi:putrescine importer